MSFGTDELFTLGFTKCDNFQIYTMQEYEIQKMQLLTELHIF